MRSFYMRIFKNIICIYVLALCCFAYATMIHAIPDHVYVQEGQKLELDKKNSGHTGNVHKTAIRYGTDRGADVSGNEAGTGSGNVQPAEAGGI